MLKFFIARIPKLHTQFESTNFVLVILLLAGLAGAAINVNTSNNVEIVAFMESESKKILQIPDSLILNLTFQTAKDEHGRVLLLFFMGERRVSLKMDYSLNLPTEQFKGTLLADTSWITGYCGMIECRTKPLPAQQRIDVLKTLVSKALTELNGKFYLIFRQDTVIPNVGDSIATPVQDSVPK
jgi:hypothetical protein